MMNGMEAPQQRNLVIPAVCPVDGDIEQQQPDDRGDRRWDRRDERTEHQARHPRQAQHRHRDCGDQSDDVEQASGQGVADVGAHIRSTDPLPVAGTQFLERDHQHEHGAHHEQPTRVDGEADTDEDQRSES